jgi:hypothetical protein
VHAIVRHQRHMTNRIVIRPAHEGDRDFQGARLIGGRPFGSRPAQATDPPIDVGFDRQRHQPAGPFRKLEQARLRPNRADHQ